MQARGICTSKEAADRWRKMTMSGQSTGWRNYLPTLVILAVLAIAFVVSLRSDVSAQPGTPALTGLGCLILVVVGLAAGFLGGMIGTGGCSVMLPAIHFWLGYPSPVAIGTTLFAVIFTAVSGGYAHLVRRNLNVRATMWLGVSGIVGRQSRWWTTQTRGLRCGLACPAL